MKPEEAYKRLCEFGAFEDPRITWYPFRWYWYTMDDGSKVMAKQGHRCYPVLYKKFTKPVQ